MIHDIDIVLSLIDSDIAHISAAGTAVLTNHIDIANARLEFSNGAVANVIASRVSREKMRRVRVFEPHRYQSLDFIAQRLDIAYPKERPGQPWPEIATESLAITPVKPLDAEIDAFVHCVANGAPPLVSGQVGKHIFGCRELSRLCFFWFFFCLFLALLFLFLIFFGEF